MNALRPFFLLAARPAVFAVGALSLFFVGITVAGLATDDARVAHYFDAVFVAAFLFPGLVGWLSGLIVQELQHTSFAMLLPNVRGRIASGFFLTGLVTTVVVVTWFALGTATPMNLAALFVIGAGAFCLGGVFIDPLSAWVTTGNTVALLVLIGRSRDVAELVTAHPLSASLCAVAIGVAAALRLFARSTFRRKPVVPTATLPGRYSLEKTQEKDRKRTIRDRRKRVTWNSGYLGGDSRRWLRAAIYESHGAHGLRAVLRSLGRAWGVLLLMLIYAWTDRGDMGFGEALARTVHDALLRSPHEPRFGEHGGPYMMVLIFIAAVGALTALYRPVALHLGLVHPLSRRQRARVHFRGGLADAGFLLFVVAPLILFVAHLTGWLVGIEPRFDFVPFYFRALMLTLILMPLAYRGRLQLLAAIRQGAENTMLGVILGVTAFVAAVTVLTMVSAGVFVSPLAELTVLVVALTISHLLYRRRVSGYYRTADLA